MSTFITIFNIPHRKYVHLFAASSQTGVPVFHEKSVPLYMSLLIPVSLLGSFVGRCNTVYITTTGRFSLCLTNNSRPYTLVGFIRLSIGYFHCAFFVQPRYRLTTSREAAWEATFVERREKHRTGAYRSRKNP